MQAQIGKWVWISYFTLWYKYVNEEKELAVKEQEKRYD